MIKRIVLLASCLAVTLGVTALSGGISQATVSASSRRLRSRRPRPSLATYLVNGKNKSSTSEPSRLMSIETTNLRGRQEIVVSWSGHIRPAASSRTRTPIEAQQEEYPFVLLECRGIDSSTVRLADQISPETCWTQNWSEHYQDSFQTEFPPYRLDQYASAGGSGAGRRCAVAAAGRVQVPASADAALGALRRRRRPGLPRRPGGLCGPAARVAECRRVGASEQRDVRRHRSRRPGQCRLRRVDLGRERIARVLADRRLRACRRADHGDQLRSFGHVLAAGDRPTGTEGQLAASQCEAKGAFAPGQLVNPQGRRRPDCQRKPVVEPFELAQPHHCAADVRGAGERLQRRQLEEHGSRLRL